MTKIVDMFEELRKARTFGFFEDFFEFVTADMWTDTSTDATATVTVSDGVKGIAAVFTDATDNNEAYLHQTKETFKFANNKPLVFEALVQYAEANTDDANVMIGLKDAWAADSLLDNGGGPAASYTGAVFFKVDGSTTWQVETSIAGTQTTTNLTAANSLDKVAHTAGGTTGGPNADGYHKFRIEFRPYSSTNADVLFYINDVHVARHDFIYTSATDMEAGVGAKAGDTNAETVNVDYIACYQVR